MPKRCVFGCPYTKPYHQFPHPERNPDRFKAWVHIAGGKLDSEEDYELYRKKVVCDIHFTEKDKNRNNRLNFLAVPSLHLPGKQDDSSEKSVLPAPEEPGNAPTFSTSYAALKQTVAEKPEEPVDAPAINPAFSTSYSAFRPTVAEKPEEPVDAPAFSPAFSASYSAFRPTVAGNCGEEIFHEAQSLNERSTLSPTMTDNCARIIASEHNYCLAEKKATKEKKNNRRQQLMPSLLLNQLKTTRRKIKVLQSTLLRSQKRNKNFKARLVDAEKISTDVLLRKVTQKMTTAAKIFTKMQYTQTSKKPSGRRFSLEEKVLSLSLYKKSPRSYPLLAKFFTLPSTKSLKRLLTKIENENENENENEKFLLLH
ncbi:uncharacterized protein LOC135086428 [Ostrinia nubilalis]|uniref:uncharacterized protein LOC135086428 n=1 Tax=Ostrinia nubilalis TaxID=29057 RepID=UPI0030823B2F